MSKIVRSSVAALVVFLLIGGCNSVRAAGNPALNAAILRLSLEWEHVKFQVDNRDEQEKQMAVIAQHAANIEQQFQNAPAAMIWVGIITSEQASMANENSSPIKALIYARRARNILEKAEKIDPVAVDAGAPTESWCALLSGPRISFGFRRQVKSSALSPRSSQECPGWFGCKLFLRRLSL